MMVDRTQAPPTQLPTKLQLITPSITTSPGGVTIHSLYAPSADVVRVSLVFDVGSRQQKKFFQASTTAAMLSEGCQDKSSAQIADHFDFYGIYYDQSVDCDSTIFTIAATNKFLGQALDMLSRMLTRPTFPLHELEVYKAKRRQQMAIDNQKPVVTASRGFLAALFGSDHPYGRTNDGEAIDELGREDLVDFAQQWLVAKNMFVVCSGNVTPQALAAISQGVDSIPGGQKTADQAPAPIAAHQTHCRAIRDKATQASIRMGCLMPGKNDPDFIPLQLLVTVLGGYFSSRLMQNLREERGYTYGVSAGLMTLKYATYMAIGCQVESEVEEQAIEQIIYEIERLATEEVAPEELAMAKNTIIGELMRLLDGPFGIADIAIENLQSGVSVDYVNQFLTRISSTTASELMALAARYFDTRSMVEMVVGRAVKSPSSLPPCKGKQGEGCSN
ncbi:MAG: pitrilysin family protein [Mucinivorans sp.]